MKQNYVELATVRTNNVSKKYLEKHEDKEKDVRRLDLGCPGIIDNAETLTYGTMRV